MTDTTDMKPKRRGGRVTSADVRASRQRRGVRALTLEFPEESFSDGTVELLKELARRLRTGEPANLPVRRDLDGFFEELRELERPTNEDVYAMGRIVTKVWDEADWDFVLKSVLAEALKGAKFPHAEAAANLPAPLAENLGRSAVQRLYRSLGQELSLSVGRLSMSEVAGLRRRLSLSKPASS